MVEKIIKNMDIQADGIWCPVIWAVLLFLYVLFMQKKNMNKLDIYFTYGVIGVIAWIANSIFAVFLDLVDFGNSSLIGLGETLTYTFVPSSLAIIYLNNFHPSTKFKRTIIFVVLSLILEGTNQWTGYMNPKHWNLLYSVPVYFVVYYFFLPFHFKLLKKWKDS